MMITIIDKAIISPQLYRHTANDMKKALITGITGPNYASSRATRLSFVGRSRMAPLIGIDDQEILKK